MTPPLRLSLHVAIVLGLVVLASLFFGPRIYVDQTLLIGDGSYYVDPSFRAILPPDTYVTRPRNFLTHIDNALNGYPRLHYVQTTFSAGEIPWWNPYLAMGLPGVGTGSATFEPVTLLLARAVSVPMPELAPVTMATLPARDALPSTSSAVERAPSLDDSAIGTPCTNGTGARCRR